MVDEGTSAAPTENVDALLESVYKPEPPMETLEAPKAPEAPRTFKLKRGDEIFEKPEPEVLSLAQKGLDYEINNRLLRTERDLFQTQKKEFEGLDAKRFKELRELDDFATKNPEFLELVKDQWAKYQTNSQEAPAGLPLLNKITELENKINPLIEQNQKFKVEKEDAELDKNLNDLKVKTKDFPWETKDEHGFTVEHKVLKHLVDGNFPNIKAAFMDLYGDNLLEMREKRVREDTLREIEDRNKKGYVLKSRLLAPNIVQQNKSVKDKSYDDLAADIIKDLGLGG